MTARCLCCTATLQRRSSCSGLETRNLTDYSILHSIVYYYCYVVVSALFIYTHFLVLHTHMMTDTTNERTCNKPTDPPFSLPAKNRRSFLRKRTARWYPRAMEIQGTGQAGGWLLIFYTPLPPPPPSPCRSRSRLVQWGFSKRIPWTSQCHRKQAIIKTTNNNSN